MKLGSSVMSVMYHYKSVLQTLEIITEKFGQLFKARRLLNNPQNCFMDSLTAFYSPNESTFYPKFCLRDFMSKNGLV